MNAMTPTERMEYLRGLSPASLQYLMAVRGHAPVFVENFTYAMMNCGDGELLMALAASNPDGSFFGFDGDAAMVGAANTRAKKLGLENVAFAQADAIAFAQAVKEGKLPKPVFDYLVLNVIGNEVLDGEMAAMMELASAVLSETGLFYMAYDVGAKETVANNDLAGALAAYKSKGLVANTEAAHAAATAKGMTYVGSANIKQNYMEFSVPAEMHTSLLQHKDKPYYEALKDMAMGARVRHDVWRVGGDLPVASEVERFGPFTFAVTSPTSYIDPQFRYFDKKIDFSTPLFTRLIGALSGYPMSMGDLMVHEDIKGATAEEVLSGMMMLVATGIAEPTASQIEIGDDVLGAKLMTAYNQRLRAEAIGSSGYLAAPALGRPVYATPTTLMCLKAIDAKGIKGAEDVLDEMLKNASPQLRAEIPANLDDETIRRNTAFHLLEHVCQEWLGFTLIHGIMKAA